MDNHVFKPDLPAPALSVGPLGWLRANLFSNWRNTLWTLLGLYLVCYEDCSDHSRYQCGEGQRRGLAFQIGAYRPALRRQAKQGFF